LTPGRLIGHILHEISPHTFADSGTYALIGAAALMGGTSRTTISLSVMLLEATGDMQVRTLALEIKFAITQLHHQYVLPLMLTLLAARYVGNFLSKGIYDVAIELKHLPYIEPSLGGYVT
jgi:chloride channel 7